MTHAPMSLPVPRMSPPGRVLRSPLSHAVTALLGVVIVVGLLIVAASLNMQSLMSKVSSGGTIDFDEGEANRADYAMAGTSALYLVAMLATAAVFIIWFHWVRRNAAGLVTACACFDMVAAVLAILFVRKVTAAQHAKALAGPAVRGS